ncbi:MAG: hypothetical protein NZ733_02430 [Aigarchaeota archaeon]|nr:hypothetical protein [Aigarchaeota archaeon]
MRRSLLGAELLIVAVLLSAPLPAASQATEPCALLVGYGGQGFLPFVDGGALNFAVGERLHVLTPAGGATVQLIDPRGRVERYELAGGIQTRLKEFGRGDGGVWRLVSGDRCEMTLTVSERGSVIYGEVVVEKDFRGAIVLSIRGPPYIGFSVEEPRDDRNVLWTRPGGELLLELGRPIRSVVVYLLYPDRVTISGKVGETPFTYTIDPLVGVYRYERPVRGTQVPVRLPELGSVGPGGTFPLRYGTYTLRVMGTAPDGQQFSMTFAVEVAPFAFRAPRLSTYLVTDVDKLREGIRLVFLNYETGTVESIALKVPMYEVVVLDERTGQPIEDYSLSVEGMIGVRDGAATVLLPRSFDLREVQVGEDVLKVKPSLIIEGVNLTGVVREVILRRGEPTVLSVPMSEVQLRVRLAGHQDAIRAKVSLNGSTPLELEGAARIRLPAYLYNATAETPWGRVGGLFDASREREVELVVYAPTDLTLALAFAAAAQLAVLAAISLRAYRAGSRHRVKSESG